MAELTLSPKPYELLTPELVSFRFRPAGLVTRSVAWITDFVLLIITKIAVFLFLIFTFPFITVEAGGVFLTIIIVLYFVFDFGYFTVFEILWNGQTPGKRINKIRVVSVTGARLSSGDVLLRNLVRIVDMLPILMTFGGLIALIHPHHRRLGDLAAATLVVDSSKRELPSSLKKYSRNTNTFAENEAMRMRIISRVTREERDLLLDLAHRRDALTPLSRSEVFAQAAEYLTDRYDIDREGLDHLSDEQTVMNIALVVQEEGRRVQQTFALGAKVN